MKSKRTVDKVADTIRDTVDNTRDALNETRHRAAADNEAQKRRGLGQAMTPGEKIGSTLTEAKQRTQAEIASTKRETRKGGKHG